MAALTESNSQEEGLMGAREEEVSEREVAEKMKKVKKEVAKKPMAAFTRTKRSSAPMRGRYKFRQGQARSDPTQGRYMFLQGHAVLKVDLLQEMVEKAHDQRKAAEERMKRVKKMQGEHWEGKLVITFPAPCPCARPATFPWSLDEVGQCYLEDNYQFKNGGALTRHLEVRKQILVS